ncbi:pyruvate dehydrogenase complex dihydrolipoamide acetyltransferase [Qipengyuania sp. XHP0207]|uniref:pyruvate dehydrogenase complex dihydrolipoamide acetyltransferase n=1 Tax=Qipengyuania sp. XHP0207 TaxID=3038078 RepID=UPI00241DB55C|nr:pyruvate dehydrogenase complex dihydrolipoamide acetyltransferase [Qipengyuania sp. XHP0207]MDG5749341.1 pyruvate dehydrogenase complex dihydrolipoamide acetyltransferase [Qipengyuania sp. XHP0207]
MPTPIKMPALSPTMEEGTLAKWLVKPGDKVEAGDIMAEIETDKATMEFEAVDEGTIASIAVEEGSEGVKVGTVIAMLAEEGEDLDEAAAAAPEGGEAAAESKSDSEPHTKAEPAKAAPRETAEPARTPVEVDTKAPAAPKDDSGERIIASPLARRIAEQKGVDLAGVTGSGPRGRIVKADVEGAEGGKAAAPAKQEATAEMAEPRVPSKTPAESEYGAPYEEEKLTNVRKVIARRLTESKQQVPHYYLAVDVRLDAMLDLRKQLNAGLEADGVKLSVNDLLIKALARALMRVPQCNVSFQGDTIHRYKRADVSVAVAAPTGLITPIITEADTKGLAAISTSMKELAEKAREGKLQPHEYQGGTASLSNLGMFGIKQFDAVINPPQGMIMAVGAGEQRPYVVDGALQVATVMTASGSFDHRAIDGADGAQLMEAFKQLCENPMGLVV